MNIQQGMIVRAKAGRDKEDFFIVVSLKDGYAYIVNGRRRKVESPKRKKLCHLTAMGELQVCEQYQTNRSVKRVLRGFLEGNSKENL